LFKQAFLFLLEIFIIFILTIFVIVLLTREIQYQAFLNVANSLMKSFFINVCLVVLCTKRSEN